MTPARYMVLLLLVTFFAVLGVAQRAHVVHLGYRAGRLEDRQKVLAKSNRELLCDIYALAQPARIAGEVGRMNIPLMDPVQLTKTVGNDGPGEAEKKPRPPRR